MLRVVWISVLNLSYPEVGKPITIDKSIKIKSRPRTTSIKVTLDLLGKLQNHLRLKFVDEKSDKLIEFFQEIVYDNLSLYFNYWKHQFLNEIVIV